MPDKTVYLLTIGDVTIENKIKSIYNIRSQTLFDLINTADLNPNEKEHIQILIEQYKDNFYLEGEDLSGTDVVVHKIPTIDNEPINARQYKFPHALRKEICRQAEELKRQGIIQISTMPYNTPVWIVPKKPDSLGNLRWRIVLLSPIK